MSIPERFYRIARHKFHELKDRIDQMDSEALDYSEQSDSRGRKPHEEALRELNASNQPGGTIPQNRTSTNTPDLGGLRSQMRSPDEIRRGVPANSGTQNTQYPMPEDPLTPHYRLLGLEPGVDFVAVQVAYQNLVVRCDPSRFPVGTEEAREAEKIRLRLETTYHLLKEALDPISRRFDILELDNQTPPSASH